MERLYSLAGEVGLGKEYLSRPVNKGFSGGEKKRSELLQALFLGKKYLLLDEIDSGLDKEGIEKLISILGELRKSKGILLISHNPFLSDKVSPDRVYRMEGGRIVH